MYKCLTFCKRCQKETVRMLSDLHDPYSTIWLCECGSRDIDLLNVETVETADVWNEMIAEESAKKRKCENGN